MDHGHHGNEGMMPGHEMPMCSMNMLFTWDTRNLCIIFSSWRVTGTFSLIWSLAAVAALTAGYELVREASRRYEESLAKKVAEVPRRNVSMEEQRGHVVKAVLYGVQVFYSFFIMLLFMTYNGWIMLSVGFGAFLGYLMFGRSTINKSAACH